MEITYNLDLYDLDLYNFQILIDKNTDNSFQHEGFGLPDNHGCRAKYVSV